MKSRFILMAVLVAAPLFSQRSTEERNARLILLGEAIQTSGVLLGQGVKDQANIQTSPGLRIMGQVSPDAPWWWEVGGHFTGSARMATNRDISPVPPPNVLDVTRVKISYSYWSVGAGYLIPVGQSADFGIHLEGRGERINPVGDFTSTAGGKEHVDVEAQYLRPWVRLSFDYKIPSEAFTTVIGGEVGVAAIKTSQKNIMPISQLDKETLRSMAPGWSAALSIGMQF